jgi:hypothetical protein
MNSLEALESRIAPAVIIGNTVQYTDIDGDHVVVSFSKPGIVAGDFTFSDAFNSTGPQQLQLIDIHGQDATFAGVNITVTATKAGGDGLAAVGTINATGVDLGKVSIDGDLVAIDAGTDSSLVPAIASLSVHSMGAYGVTTQGASPLLNSMISGKLPVLKVAGNMTDVTMVVTGATGSIGSVAIGGSLVGGEGDSSGDLVAGDNTYADSIGSVTIGKDLVGSTGLSSGVIGAFGSIGTVKIGGNIIGGGSGESGLVLAFQNLASVTVGGSVFGGAGTESGSIVGQASLGTVLVKGNFSGGSYAGSGNQSELGVIASVGHINSVTIGGSIISGFNIGSGSLVQSASIFSSKADIGSIVVDGSVIGNEEAPVTFSAVGQAVKPASGLDLAIGSVTIKGSATHANILAGFDGSLTDANADASIGKIAVTGNWTAGNIVAGAHQASAPNWGVGDTPQTVGDTNLVAHIASIVIGGTLEGSVTSTETFGFVAQEIDALKIDGKSYTLTAGPGNDDFQLGLNSDANAYVEEV